MKRDPIILCAVKDPDRLYQFAKKSDCIASGRVPFHTVSGRRNVPRALNELFDKLATEGTIRGSSMVFYMHEDVRLEGQYIESVMDMLNDENRVAFHEPFMIGCCGARFEDKPDGTKQSAVYAHMIDRGYVSKNIGNTTFVEVDTLDECFIGMPFHQKFYETKSGKHLYAARTALIDTMRCFVACAETLHHESEQEWTINDPMFAFDCGALYDAVGEFCTPCVTIKETKDGIVIPMYPDLIPRKSPLVPATKAGLTLRSLLGK